jgi:hypothetical protein
MRSLTAALLLTIGWVGAAQAAHAVGPLRIAVMTMEPGEIFWERFGHNAILVADADKGTVVSYNFGFFDLSEPGFVGNFIRGRMRYRLLALPVAKDLALYRREGRGASAQWLNLDPTQARTLAMALAENAKPENAVYRYDYYTDNCSTRVRDAIDAAVGGALERQLVGRSQGNTYRSESVRLAWPAKWMAFGFHLSLAGSADRPLSRWDEAFIPMRLRDSLREAKLADGRPLVVAEQGLSTHRIPRPPTDMPTWRVPAFLLGIGIALAVLRAGRNRPRTLAALALPFWLLAGLTGSLMLFLWLATEHAAAHGNENILLLSPACLLLLPGAWRLVRGHALSTRFHWLLWLVAGSAAIAGFLKFLPFRPQENVEWVLLLLPVHWALARSLSPQACENHAPER